VGWNDFVNTLAGIIEFEGYLSSVISFNLTDPDPAINPGDHSDHIHTTIAMQQVASTKPCVNQNLFLSYSSVAKPINVTGDDLYVDVGTWAVTTSGLSDNNTGSNWASDHKKWLGKNYFRTVPGTGLCN
jgi:hypothetical protein